MARARRSILFVPANNPRALDKARTLGADAVIVDLEDAIAPADKEAARAAIASLGRFGAAETVIRVNGTHTPWHAADMRAAAGVADAILLPKVQAAAEIAAARSLAGGVPLWAMIETPRAVLSALEIAGAGTDCLVFGMNDFMLGMDGRHRADRANLFTAMSLCVMAARAAGVMVIDGVHNQIDDAEGFVRTAAEARDFGFDGKSCIHPVQVAPCNTAFTPSADEVVWAKKVLAAFAAAPDKGVLALEGRMIEGLDADRARRILARAGS